MPLVAKIGGESVGLPWARLDSTEPGDVYVHQMWVEPIARGAGVGRMPLAAAVDWARGIDARRVRLSVTHGNAPAARLYARFGFEPVGLPHPLRAGSLLLVQPLQLELRDA